MKNVTTIAAGSLFLCFFLFTVNYSFGQKPFPSVKIPVNAGGEINFKELAEYRLAHPLPLSKFHIADPDKGLDEDKKFKPGKVNEPVKVFNFPTTKRLTPEIVSPPAITVFNGVVDNHTLIPPDVGGTVGDSIVIATTNQGFALYTKTGVSKGKLDIGTFFSAAGLPSGGDFSDPHATYDAVYHKFIVVILYYIPNSGGYNSYLAIAVSKTPDPTGAWYQYTFKPYTNTTTLFDYPQIGLNNKWVVITGNGFPAAGGEQAQVVVLNRADLYSGVAGTATSVTDSKIVSIAPAVTTDTSVANVNMVADYSGTVGYVRLFTVSGPVGAPVFTEGSIVSVNQHWSENAVNAKQLGSTETIPINDTRIINAVFTNGSIWFSHAVYLPAGKPVNSGADWWQVDPVKDSVIQFGRIYDTTGSLFYYYPSIAVDAAGNVLVGYTVSSTGMYASGGYSFHAATDPPNTMEDNYTYKNGTAAYNTTGGDDRWGDFSISSLDPSNGNFWTMQDYATSPANTWATTIAEIATLACSGKPVAGSITSTDSVCNGTSAILGLGGSTQASGISYQWQQSPNGSTGWVNATGTGATSSSFTSATLSTPMYFRCIVKCISSSLSDTTNAQLITISNISVNVTGSADRICKGMSDTLHATGANTYSWSPGGATGSTLIVKPTLQSTYTVTGTSIIGCKGSATFTVKISKVTVAASKDTVCLLKDSAILTASGAVNYVWHPGNQTGSSIVVKPTVNSVYTAVGTDSIGCVDSASVTVHVADCVLGVNTIGTTTGIQIFPAPAKNSFTLEISGLAGRNCDLSIINILGKKLFTSKLNVNTDDFHQLIDISKFTPGIYFVQVSYGSKQWNAKIVKQ